MFRGRHEHAIDGKGRTSVPSRFRDLLAAGGDCRVVMTRGLINPCLVAYSPSEWATFEERLAALPQQDPTIAFMVHVSVGNAVDCEIDKLGRLLVPAPLREYAGLSREVLWIGALKRIELWDKARWEEAQAAVLNDPQERLAVARKLGELGL